MKLLKALTISLILILGACADQSPRSLESQLESAGLGIQGGELVSKATDPVTKQVKSVLVMIHQEGFKPHCGGVLISPQLVLTAAHCLYDEDSKNLIAVKELKIATCIDRRSEGCNWAPVNSYIVHEAYQKPQKVGEERRNDLALIQLSKAVKNRPLIVYASSSPNVGEELFVFGSGLTHKDASLDLMMRTVRLTSDRISNQIVGGSDFNGRYLGMQTSSKGLCPGDSGAPVFIIQNGKIVLSGINAGGTFLSDGYACGATAALIMDISQYLDWIRGTSKRLAGDPQEVRTIK